MKILFLFGTILLIGVHLLVAPQSVLAQSQNPPTAATPSAITADDLTKITARLDQLEIAKQSAERWLVLVGIGSVIAVIYAFWGIPQFMRKQFEDSIQRSKQYAIDEAERIVRTDVNSRLADIRGYLDSQLAILKTDLTDRFRQVDPGQVLVKIPRSKFDKERLRLERLGFRQFERYDQFGQGCLSGCVVIKLTDPAIDPSDLNAFNDFLDASSLDEEKVHYLIYTDGRVPPETFRKFESMTYANSIVTLANNLLTLARHYSR